MFFKATCQTNQIRIRFQSLLLKSLRLTKPWNGSPFRWRCWRHLPHVPHRFCFSKTTISQQRNKGFLRISMNSLRVSGFTPGFGNNHDFSVFINQNKIHRVLFSSARYFADVCAAFWGKRFRCLISSLETHCWTVQQSGFRIHHRERHFPHPSNLWSEAISTLPKRCHKKIQETDLEASWHWWYYIILHLLSLLTKLSERNFHQFYDSRSSTFHLFQWYSSLFIHFIHLRPWTEMESGLPSPMNRRSAANAARTQKRSETESLEFCKIPGVPKSVEMLVDVLNIWELCSIRSKREKRRVEREMCFSVSEIFWTWNLTVQ